MLLGNISLAIKTIHLLSFFAFAYIQGCSDVAMSELSSSTYALAIVGVISGILQVTIGVPCELKPFQAKPLFVSLFLHPFFIHRKILPPACFIQSAWYLYPKVADLLYFSTAKNLVMLVSCVCALVK